MTKPESIENRWDILYRDYPEVYEAFSNTPYRPTIFERLPKIVNLVDQSIADVGSGTGTSSFALAAFASRVIGIEFERAMLQKAQAFSVSDAAERVMFLAGDALALPLADRSVDVVTAITLALYPPEQYRAFISEALRVASKQVVYVGIPPGWYGGELYEVIEDFEKVDDIVDGIFINECGFRYQDVESIQDYGDVEHIVNTYGFIFGKKAIEHLRRENKTTIRWMFRVYWKDSKDHP
jgi:ubiquinone/menaquinone biosynthesis C-methylase UbiE